MEFVMFTFFHRKKKVILDCFTDNKMAHGVTPIVRAIKTIPDWWKSLPKTYNEEPIKAFHDKPTMKNCAGFVELYKRGFVIESWGDFSFQVSSDHTYNWKCSNPYLSGVDGHSPTQYGLSFKRHEHAKLVSPWMFRCDKNHYFMFSPATWSLDNYDFHILPGVVEYHYQNSTSINMMIPIKQEKYSFDILAGMPLVHIIPLNDSCSYEIRNHHVSTEELNKIRNNTAVYGHNSYNRMKKLLIRNEERSKSKCPFG
jgi:hypothetical protein